MHKKVIVFLSKSKILLYSCMSSVFSKINQNKTRTPKSKIKLTWLLYHIKRATGDISTIVIILDIFLFCIYLFMRVITAYTRNEENMSNQYILAIKKFVKITFDPINKSIVKYIKLLSNFIALANTTKNNTVSI